MAVDYDNASGDFTVRVGGKELLARLTNIEQQVNTLVATGPGNMDRLADRVERVEGTIRNEIFSVRDTVLAHQTESRNTSADFESRIRALEQFRWSLPVGLGTSVVALFTAVLQFFI